MNTVVLILYAQLSQHSEMCFLWSRGTICRKPYSKKPISDFFCVAVFASESQLWFQGTVTYLLSSKRLQGKKICLLLTQLPGSTLEWAMCRALCLNQPLLYCCCSAKLFHFATAQCQHCDCSWSVSRWILVFKTDKDCKNWNPLLGSFLMPY